MNSSLGTTHQAVASTLDCDWLEDYSDSMVADRDGGPSAHDRL